MQEPNLLGQEEDPQEIGMEGEKTQTPTWTLEGDSSEKEKQENEQQKEETKEEIEGQERPSLPTSNPDKEGQLDTMTEVIGQEGNNVSPEDKEIEEDPDSFSTQDQNQEEDEDTEDFDPETVVSDTAFWHVSQSVDNIMNDLLDFNTLLSFSFCKD